MSRSTEAERLIGAASRIDWMQVALHRGDSPCFHLEADGRFCLRARSWAGHASASGHPHEPLYVAMTRVAKGVEVADDS